MRQFFLILLAGSVFATGEYSWIDDGVPVRQGVHIEWQRTGDSGAEGEMIFAWSDTRTGDRDIYVQKVDTTGATLWGETGIRATVAVGRQEDPVLVSDGAGGAFLAWIDYRDDEYGDVYAQHLDSDGNLSWDPTGLPIAVNNGSQQSLNMARGATGVAYVIWDDGSLSESGDIFGTVLTLTGALAAGGTDGLVLVNATGTQTKHSIETSGSEVVVVWQDTRDANDPDIFGQRLDVDFTGLWGENGISVCGHSSNQAYPKVAPAAGNSVAISWLDDRNNIKTDIFSQLLAENGTAEWTVDGISITNQVSEQNFCRIKSNGVDRIYYVWEDFRNNATDPDIFMQSVDLSGAPQWTVDGIPVVEFTLKQKQPRFTLADGGGMYVTWLDERGGGFPQSDIYLQHVDPSGTMGFVENGLALTSGYKYQTGGLVRTDGDGGVLVLWSNAASGSIGIMGQHVSLTGSQSWDIDGQEFFFGIDGDAAKFQALPWGDNAAMIFWEDNRWAGTGAVSMAQVMDVNGSILYDMDGVVLSGNEQQIDPVITPDNAGGAYLAYTNITGGTEILYGQHVGDDLAPTWPSVGLPVNPSAGLGQFKPHLVTGEDNYLYYFWTEAYPFEFRRLYVQKFSIDGDAQWQAGGFHISSPTISGDKYITNLVAMADSSIIFIWEAETTDSIKTYISKLAVDGDVEWSAPVSVSPGSQFNSVAVNNFDSGSVTVGWEDTRDSTTSGVDLYALTIDTDGSVIDEFVIADGFGDQKELALSLTDDDSGVLYAAWQNFNGFHHDIFVKNLTTGTAADQITALAFENKNPALRAVNASRYLVAWEDDRNGIHTDLYFYDSELGSLGHAPDGIPLCLAVLNQAQPQIIPFASNTTESLVYLLAWQDMRSSGKTELTNIYAQAYAFTVSSVDAPELVEDFKLRAAYPNPFNGSVTIPIENLAGATLNVRIYDVQGREILNQELGTNGASHNYVWDGLDMGGNSLSSGVYLITVASEYQRFSQKILLLK